MTRIVAIARLGLAPLAAAVLVGVTGSSGALAAHRTTAPAPAAPVPVTLNAHSIKIRSYISKSGKALYPRGALIDFILKNNTGQDVSVRIKLNSKINFQGASSIATYTPAGKPLRPGKLRHFKINFFFRSNFLMQELVHGKVLASFPIVVF
jgi:hypothetical protein